MGKKVREYKSGDFIFAKVKGYPAWPARVQRQNGKKYFVYFYGTGETANLPPNMIFDYSENKDKFLNKSVKRKDFNDGVKQIEHDFANNVPLEQVVGALAEADPGPANDSLNDTANETADDSAIADTTADETMDETATDGPVEDSDDAGALVIDEGKQKARKSSVKPPATPKAKEPKTPRGRPRKEESKEAKEAKEAEEEEKKDEEIVSRSGRKIRPKRYMDEQTEENSTLPSPASKKRRGASPSAEKEKTEPKEKPQDKNIRAYNTVQQSELRELKEPFKSADPDKEDILITFLPSGTYCGVKLFQSRPASFKSDASRLQWDKQAASNAITLKRQLEKGQITPQSISAQLVMDLNLTDEEKEKLDKDRDLEIKKSRLHFLKTEMKLIELDAKIKTCLSLEKADTELCLKLIDEILELDLAALMLLKHPTCMETVKRMRVYVGNTPSWAMTESEALTFSKQAHRIRNKADALFITMRDLFDVPEGLSFWEFFNERVAQFKAVTENLHADKLLEMVHEPIGSDEREGRKFWQLFNARVARFKADRDTGYEEAERLLEMAYKPKEMSQPTSHTMKAAIDAANEEDAAEAEDTDKKKKATPAKAKKANSTPLKQPLKRQPRKQQQEEKEKEKEAEKPAEDKPEEPDTDKPTENDKTDSTEAPKENNDDKSNADKANENEPDEADKEVEKVNENSDKTDPKEAVSEEKADSEKPKKDKEKESNSKDIESKTNETDKTEDKDSEASAKESKKSKDDKSSDKNSKDSKSKEKNDKGKDDKKDDAKNGKDKARGDKRKEKGKDEKDKSEEKEKVDVDEPRAKRSRESKKTEPPPRSPAKRKSKS